MKQCETCLHREYKDKLLGCSVTSLFHAIRELLKQLPLFGKDFQDYECSNYCRRSDDC